MSGCLAAVVLEGFYAARLRAERTGAFLIHRDRRVLDASHEASIRGVRAGMGLAEARTILGPEGTCIAWEEEPFREAQEKWLEIAAEFADVIEPLRQHEALLDLSGHPRPREAAAKLERRLAKELGEAVRVGVGLASCRWVALRAARNGDSHGLALADPDSYVTNLATIDLPIPTPHAEHLVRLGYRTAGAVAAIDADVLRGQFGEEAHPITIAARGRGNGSVKSLFPLNSVWARIVFDGAAETREVLEEGARALARELGEKLSEQDLAGKRMDLFLEGEDGSVTCRSRVFARAISKHREALAALRLMLAEDPENPPLSLRVRLPKLDATRRVQLELDGARAQADMRQSTKAAVENVRAAYGDGAVMRLSEKPVPRYVRVRRAYQRVNGWTWG